MKIELHRIPIRDVVEGYEDRGEDGVVGYGAQEKDIKERVTKMATRYILIQKILYKMKVGELVLSVANFLIVKGKTIAYKT